MAGNDSDHGRTQSLWQATFTPPDHPPLRQSLETDVCVIGAGIAGLTAAYHLARAGRAVVVLDKTGIGRGETAFTTAHLSNAIDDRYVHVKRLHGLEGARLAADSHDAAIDAIERIVAREAIDCDFARLDGYLFVPPGDAYDLLDDELAAARQAGLGAVERIERAPLSTFDTGPCLRFPDQGQFHPLRYVAGLAAAIERHGGRLFGGTRVREVRADESAATVDTVDAVRVSANVVVIATNAPIAGPKEIDLKQAAYQTYVVAGVIPKGSVPRALFWDTADPYHYVRTAPSDEPRSEYLIVGGEDHKTGKQPEGDPFAKLESWTRQRFPMVERFVQGWSGEVMETMDGLALIGRVPGEQRLYEITGDSGMGMTHGTLGGQLVADLILGQPNDWTSLYEPSRKRSIATGGFFRETFDMVRSAARRLEGPEVKDVMDIPRDHGAVMQEGRDKLAVYRGPSGELHRMSAVCTHLGCIVAWNDTEKSWDCPCHGSRFDRFGKAIHGPAVQDLKQLENAASERR